MRLTDVMKSQYSQNSPIEPLLREGDVAKILNVSVQQIRTMRRINNGPKVTRIGARTVRYSPSDVREYLTSLQPRQAHPELPMAQKQPSTTMLVEDIFK